MTFWSFIFRCGSSEVILPVVHSYILVKPAATPSITLRGKSTLHGTEDKLKMGIPIFEDINISVDFAVKKTEGKVNHILGKDEIKDDSSDSIELGKEEKLQLKLEKKKAKREYCRIFNKIFDRIYLYKILLKWETCKVIMKEISFTHSNHEKKIYINLCSLGIIFLLIHYLEKK